MVQICNLVTLLVFIFNRKENQIVPYNDNKTVFLSKTFRKVIMLWKEWKILCDWNWNKLTDVNEYELWMPLGWNTQNYYKIFFCKRVFQQNPLI